MIEPVFFEVGEIEHLVTPFAVIAIYPERRQGGGCVGVVMSLHETRPEAAAAAQVQRDAGK